MEFRHHTWYAEQTYSLLRENNVALASVETEENKPVFEKTADFAYLRLRKEAYSPSEIKRWASRILEISAHSNPIYMYLKHDEKGFSTRHATELARLL